MAKDTPRTQVIRKVYTYADGETGRSAKPEWASLTFEFLSPKKDENENLVVLETRTIDKAKFMETNPEMVDCAIGHGLSQKLGDALAGVPGRAAKAEPSVKPDKERGFCDFALELFEDAWNNILQDVWITEAEGSGGASVTMLYQAIVAAFTDAGKELDEAGQAQIKSKLKDDDYRKKAKDNPEVASHMARIAAERAAARAKKAKEALKESDGTGLADLVA